MSIVLPGTGLPKVTDANVWFKVKVDVARCGPPSAGTHAALTRIEQDGFLVPISRLVSYSSIFFPHAADHWGIGDDRARIANAWARLLNWKPDVTQDSLERPRFTLDPKVAAMEGASGDKRWISELLGVGVGLAVAREVYGVPHRKWHSLGAGRLDYEGRRPDGRSVQVELRGRFERQNWQSAVRQVHEKISAGAPVDERAGILFAPRTNVGHRTEEILIVDPEGEDPTVPDPHRHERALLLHYRDVFLTQASRDVAERLRSLAELPGPLFERFLQNGDRVLHLLTSRLDAITVLGRTFLGTVIGPIEPPAFLRSEPNDGGPAVLSDLVLADVVGALVRGDLGVILSMVGDEGVVREEGLTGYLSDDGRLLLWTSGERRPREGHPPRTRRDWALLWVFAEGASRSGSMSIIGDPVGADEDNEFATLDDLVVVVDHPR